MSQEAENRTGEETRIKGVPRREKSYKEERRPKKQREEPEKDKAAEPPTREGRPKRRQKNKAPRPIGRERKYPGKAYTKVDRQKYKDKPKEKQQRGKTAAEGHHRTTGRREGCRRGTLGRMWPHGKHYFNPWGWKSGRRPGCSLRLAPALLPWLGRPRTPAGGDG